MGVSLFRKLILWSVLVGVVPRVIAEFFHSSTPSPFDTMSPALLGLTAIFGITCLVATFAFYRLVSWGRALATFSTIVSTLMLIVLPIDTQSSIVAATDYCSAILWGA